MSHIATLVQSPRLSLQVIALQPDTAGDHNWVLHLVGVEFESGVDLLDTFGIKIPNRVTMVLDVAPDGDHDGTGTGPDRPVPNAWLWGPSGIHARKVVSCQVSVAVGEKRNTGCICYPVGGCAHGTKSSASERVWELHVV